MTFSNALSASYKAAGLFIVLGASGCATSVKTVTQSITDNCVKQQTTAFNKKVKSRKSQDKEVGALLKKFTINTGFSEQCSQHQVLVLLAQDNTELGMISKIAILKMVADGSPENKESIVRALRASGSSVESIEMHVSERNASVAIAHAAANLEKNENIEFLINTYDGEAYPDLDPKTVQAMVNDALAAKDTTIDDLCDTHVSRNADEKVSCGVYQDEKGANYLTCKKAQVWGVSSICYLELN